MYFLRFINFCKFFSKLSHFMFRAVATYYVSLIFTFHIRIYLFKFSLWVGVCGQGGWRGLIVTLGAVKNFNEHRGGRRDNSRGVV